MFCVLSYSKRTNRVFKVNLIIFRFTSGPLFFLHDVLTQSLIEKNIPLSLFLCVKHHVVSTQTYDQNRGNRVRFLYWKRLEVKGVDPLLLVWVEHSYRTLNFCSKHLVDRVLDFIPSTRFFTIGTQENDGVIIPSPVTSRPPPLEP